MNKRSILLLCCAVVLLGIFLLAVLLVERNLTQKEQNIQATATVYVPTTAPLPTTDDSQPTQPTEPEAVTAPEFVITDKDGRTYGILNFKGNPTILCFWTAKAEKELDRMQEFYELYGDVANFVMLHMTSQEETKEEALAFLQEKDYTFPVYFDTLGSAVTAYKVTVSPTSYFMTSENVLTARAKGALDPAALPKVLESIGLSYTEE